MLDNEDIPRYKVTIIGESGVGKTCLLSRFINDKYDDDILSNLCALYTSKELEYEDLGKIKIQLDIWDTAGEEKFRSISKVFYKDTDAAILVYDCTDRRSFEEMKNYWYKELKERAPESIIIAIAVSKCDLIEDEEVSEEEGRNFAKEIGAIFKATSALSGVGIMELFKAIGYKLLDPNFNLDEPKKEISEEEKEKIRKSISQKGDEKGNENIFEIKKEVKEVEENWFKKMFKKFCFIF